MLSIFRKKKKSGYPRSFAKRLTWRIMLRMLIIMGVPTFFVFWLGYGLVYLGAAGLCERLVKGEYEEVRRITSDVYVATVNTTPVIEDYIDQPDKMAFILERMLKQNPRIRSCGISFIESYYPAKGRWFCPYAVRRDSTTIETQIIGSKEYDYLNQDWFKEALSKDEGYWSKAFFEGNGQETPLVSYLVPIHDKQKRTVAILGVDMSLDWLNEKVRFIKGQHLNDSVAGADSTWNAANYGFYFFMVDTTGTLLIHPDQKRILREKLQDHVSKDPNKTTQRILSLKDDDDDELVLDGIEVYVSFRPVKYTDWSLALAIPTLIIEIFGYIIGAIMIVMIIFGLLVVYFVGRRLIKKAVKPLTQLATSAHEVAKGNFDTPLPVLKSRDEIHMLRDSFENMQHSLTKYIEELKTTTAQKSAMESELKIAHDIQMSMLPKTFPPFPERKDIDIYGMLTPAKGVGGDLFDFHIRDEKLFFCIGDVSGKGIPAALVMAVTRSLFHNISSYANRPNDIAYSLNNALAYGNETNMFVTIFIGVLDLPTGHLLYCNAGHNAPLLVGRDVSELACDPNLPAGILPDFAFTLQETDLEPMTTIFLFTDGLNEAENTLQAQFGDERIQDVARQVLAKGEHQPLNIIYEMHEAVRRFVGEAEQSDDLTMLAVQYTVKDVKTGTENQEKLG